MNSHYDITGEGNASAYNWTENQPLFSERVKSRHHNWWKNKKAMWQKRLSDKVKGELFCTDLGVPVVPKILVTESYDDTRLFDLPSDYVIKTSHGKNSEQVYPVRNGVNVFTNEKITITEILENLANDTFLHGLKYQIIVEELVKD